MGKRLDKAAGMLADLLDFFGRAAMWPVGWPLRRIHRWLDEHILERPGFWGNLWRLFHRSDWQKSAKFNARVWVVGFVCFYPVARQIGHPLWVNVLVTLGLDAVVYAYHKGKVWPERQISVPKSYSPWWTFTALTFLLNLGVGYVLVHEAEMGKLSYKVTTAAAGVLINPWIFKFRDKRAIRDLSPRTEA